MTVARGATALAIRALEELLPEETLEGTPEETIDKAADSKETEEPDPLFKEFVLLEIFDNNLAREAKRKKITRANKAFEEYDTKTLDEIAYGLGIRRMEFLEYIRKADTRMSAYKVLGAKNGNIVNECVYASGSVLDLYIRSLITSHATKTRQQSIAIGQSCHGLGDKHLCSPVLAKHEQTMQQYRENKLPLFLFLREEHLQVYNPSIKELLFYALNLEESKDNHKDYLLD